MGGSAAVTIFLEVVVVVRRASSRVPEGVAQHGLRWTRDDVAFLRNAWGELSRGLIRRRLGRRWTGIVQKALALGLPVGVPQGQEVVAHAARRHHVSAWLLRRILRRYGVQIHRTYGRENRVAGRVKCRYVDPDDVDRAMAAWNTLMTFTKYCRSRSIGVSTMRRLLHAAGVEVIKDGQGVTSRILVDPKAADVVVGAYRSTLRGLAGTRQAASIRSRRDAPVLEDPACWVCWGVSEMTDGRVKVCRWCVGLGSDLA